jgi:hypothetical protein
MIIHKDKEERKEGRKEAEELEKKRPQEVYRNEGECTKPCYIFPISFVLSVQDCLFIIYFASSCVLQIRECCFIQKKMSDQSEYIIEVQAEMYMWTQDRSRIWKTMSEIREGFIMMFLPHRYN